MKRSFIFLLIWGIIIYSCQKKEDKNMISENPFFTEYDTPFSVPPFDRISTEHYLPAILKGIEEQKVEIDQITSDKSAPSFSNTIEVLEYSGSSLQKVLDVYNNALLANNSEALQKVARKVAPILTAHEDDITLDSILFTRVKTVYGNQAELSLNTEEERLLEETYKSFVRNGANLQESEKEELKKINEKLALLTLQFGNNLLAEDNGWKLVIDNEEDLAGLPEMIISSAAEAAKEAGHPGQWVISLHKPSWIPFLQYSAKRELREQVYKAWRTRGTNNNDHDTTTVLTEIIELRGAQAQMRSRC
jgi:peptidyl-dipeptidase Dcp